MKTLQVDLGDRSYPIYIGSGLLNDNDILTRHIKSRQVVIVTNETIAPLYLDRVRSMLKDFAVETVVENRPFYFV